MTENTGSYPPQKHSTTAAASDRNPSSARSIVTREDAISAPGRTLTTLSRFIVRPMLHVFTYFLAFPWPYGMVNTLARFVVVPPRGTHRGLVHLQNCRAEVVRARGVGAADGSGRAILYLHGGAFITGGPNTHARLAATLSRESGAPVLSVDYRMLPKSPVDAAVQDSLDGYRWLLGRGYRPDQIAVAGDSAGGYFAFMIALSLLKEGQPPPAAIAALSPLTEFDTAGKLNHPNARTDAVFTRRFFSVILRMVQLQNSAARNSANGIGGSLVEPTTEDLSQMPPTLIHASSSESLRYDAELMAERLAAAGADVRLKSWAGQVHVFQIAELFVPEARQSLSEIGAFIRQRTAQR